MHSRSQLQTWMKAISRAYAQDVNNVLSSVYFARSLSLCASLRCSCLTSIISLGLRGLEGCLRILSAVDGLAIFVFD